MGKRHSQAAGFSNPFLGELFGEFLRRKRPIQQKSDLKFWKEASQDGGTPDNESLTISLVVGRRALVLEVFVHNIANVYLRSVSNRDRGKVLFRLEGLRLLPSASAVIACLEEGLDVLKRADANSNAFEILEQLWRECSLVSVD